MYIEPETLQSMEPDDVFMFLTSAIYKARERGAWQEIDAILSIFEPDARRALCIGAAAMRIMPGTYADAYRNELKTNMAAMLYHTLQEART